MTTNFVEVYVSRGFTFLIIMTYQQFFQAYMLCISNKWQQCPHHFPGTPISKVNRVVYFFNMGDNDVQCI